MEFNFLEYFYTDKYDNEIIIKNNDKSFSVFEIKKLVTSEIEHIKQLNENNIMINTNNHFDFIILFISCILAEKNIIVSNNNNKSKEIETSIKLSQITYNKDILNPVFKRIDHTKSKIYLYTSGTTSKPKIINKDYNCITKESYDVISELGFNRSEKLEFITTTPINHLYAITAFIFAPLNSHNVINTNKVDYFEDINVQNSVLITSPSFLAYMQKYNLNPVVNPQIILSAGANLKKELHKYFEENSTVINLYGSSETGFIAFKNNSEKEYLKLFNGIKILSVDENQTTILSDYSKPEEIILDDKIIMHNDRTIEIKGRSDRVFKIQEKRVSAAELEEELSKNAYIKTCCLIDLDDKIGAITELTPLGVQFLKEKGIPELIKNLKSDLSAKFAIIPQKWKFIDEIPTNAMGKYDYNKIKEIFSLNLSLPFILKRNITPEEAEFELFFYKNCNFFKGHFDGFPIVAGVVQLFYAAYFAQIAFGKDYYLGQIKRIKFSNIIHADTIAKLKLSKSEKGINFEYLDENKSYSSGSLPTDNIFKELEYAK